MEGEMGRAGIVVLGFDEVDTGLSPLLGEHICIVHVHIDGSAADPLRIRALSGEMDGQLVAMGERIPLDKRRQASPAGSTADSVLRGAAREVLSGSERARGRTEFGCFRPKELADV
jgi:hypothetical protein